MTPIRLHSASLLALLFAFGLPGCQPGSAEVAALRAEVAALRNEVERLRERVNRLPGGVGEGRQPSSGERDGGVRDGAEPEGHGLILFRFSASPVGARISVDGAPVANNTFQAPADGRLRKVRVERPGHRTLEQAVRADRDRTLRYVLRPGRGIQQLAPAR